MQGSAGSAGTPQVFGSPGALRDLVILVYVDDILADGKGEDNLIQYV